MVPAVSVSLCWCCHAESGRVRTPRAGATGAGVASCVTAHGHQELKCVDARQVVLQGFNNPGMAFLQGASAASLCSSLEPSLGLQDC